MGYTKNRNFIGSRISKFLRPAQSQFLRPVQSQNAKRTQKSHEIWVIPKIEIFIGSRISKFCARRNHNFCARRNHKMQKELKKVMRYGLYKKSKFYRVPNLQIFAPGAITKCKKNSNGVVRCRPTCRCHHLGYSVPPALHRTIWCRSTFEPRGPGLSNPTFFLRPALPMAPTRDYNARDKRSVLRQTQQHS